MVCDNKVAKTVVHSTKLSMINEIHNNCCPTVGRMCQAKEGNMSPLGTATSPLPADVPDEGKHYVAARDSSVHAAWPDTSFGSLKWRRHVMMRNKIYPLQIQALCLA